MRSKRTTIGLLRAAVAVCGVLTAGGVPAPRAAADQLDPNRVPADASLVVHVDLDRLRETKAYERFLSKLVTDASGNLPPGIAQLKETAGVEVNDLHDITAYALSDPNHLLFLVHARMDREKVLSAIRKAVGKSAETGYGKYKVLHWGEGDQTAFATFQDDGRLVVARSDEDLHQALDAIDGKAGRLKADSLLAGRSPAGKPGIDSHERPVLFVGLTKLDKLAKSLAEGDDKLPPLVKKVAGGWVSLGENGGGGDTDVVLRAAVSTTDADSAQMMQQAVDGARAMIQLAAGADNDPELKMVSDLLRGVTTSREERDVSVRLAVPLARLSEVLKTLDVEADDQGEPGEKHRVRLQLKVGDAKEAKEKDAGRNEAKELESKEKPRRDDKE